VRIGPLSLVLEPRLEMPRWARAMQPVVGVLVALLMGALFLLLAGVDPVAVYGHILQAGFLGGYAWSDTIVKSTPIMLCALGVAVAFRMRLWNIGSEGQLFMGAWAASGVALFWLPATTPRPVMLGAMMLAGMAAGGAWGALAGALKARLGVSEIITTLMLNYVAAQWLCYFVFGPWSERGFQLTPQFPPTAWLPRLTDAASSVPALAGLTAHAGVLFGLAAAAVLALVLDRSRWGFEIRAIGDGARAAQAAGMPARRNIVLVMVLSGAMAGLAGMSEVAGVVHRLQDRFSPGYGFTGIIVAWLGGLRPWAIVVVSLLFGGLLVGGKEIQPAGIPQMLQGLMLFVIVGAETMFRYRVRLAVEVRTS
jgi:ABC-type uncharacterized transport system permease subunit